MFALKCFLKTEIKTGVTCYLSVEIFSLCVLSRSSWAILQFDMVPQSYPGSRPNACHWLSQWPLYSAVGPEKTLHSGPVCRCAARCGAVLKRIINRWVGGFSRDHHFTVTAPPPSVCVSWCSLRPLCRWQSRQPAHWHHPDCGRGGGVGLQRRCLGGTNQSLSSWCCWHRRARYGFEYSCVLCW